MEAKRSRQALLCTALVALLSQNLFIPIVCTANLEDQKNYYTPDPNAHPPPAVTYPSPPYGSGGGHASPTPSHGTPSHGGGGGTPPSNCGDPPSGGHHHTTPSPGHYHAPPTPTPTTPTPPTGGGYYHSPPSTTPTTPTPTTPTPTTPTTPYVSPPTTPIDPGTPSPPSITIPSPPFTFNPSSPPFTCTYWRNHPTLVWGLFGFWGTVGNTFGTPSVPGLGANMNLLQALSNSRTDGYGELYREGTAALLNSMAHTRFPYSTNQVRDSFVTALSSNKAASAQAQLFKLANEGRIKPRA